MAKKRNNAKRTTGTGANRSQPAAAKPATSRAASASGTSNGSSSRAAVPAEKPKTSAATTRTNGPSAASTRLAEARARNAAQRAQAQRRAATNTFWRRNWPILASVVSVVVLIGIFVAIANRSASAAGIGDPAPSTLMKQVTSVSTTVFDTVGTGSITKTSLQVPQGATVLKDSDGKPIVLYIGADYCPFCAAERWSMVVALSRFGTFKDLHLMKSGVSDGNISTFTFHGSSYTSQYLTFQAVETADRNGNPLETPTADQQAIFAKYDAPPYTNTAGGIPFFSIANQYIQTNAGYQSSVISDLTWQQIGDKLSDPNDPVTKAIVGEANYLTAAICQTTGQQPESVCKSATIQQIAAKLPKGS